MMTTMTTAPEIDFESFLAVDIRVGRIVRIEDYPEARQPAYKIWVDFGAGIGERKTSAQLTGLYQKDDLLGRLIAAVVNFPNKQIGTFMSEILVLGFPDSAGEVVLISPDREVPVGGRLF